jgi:hypothetical protein
MIIYSLIKWSVAPELMTMLLYEIENLSLCWISQLGRYFRLNY